MREAWMLMLCWILFASPVDAAVLSWHEIVSTAREAHPEIRALREDAASANSLAWSSKGEYLPKVSLFADRTKNHTETDLLGVRTSGDATTDTYGVTTTWNLFSGFASTGRSRRTEAIATKGRMTMLSGWLQARNDLRKTYDGALLAKESVTVYDRLRSRYSDQVKIIEAKYRSGLEALWALDLARANLALVEASLKTEKMNLQKALTDLTRLLGTDVQDVKEDARFSKAVLPKRPSFSAEDHPDFLGKKADSDQADADVTIQNARFMPSLDFSWKTTRSKVDVNDPANQSSYSFTLTYPLFEGFSGWNDNSAARARRRAAEIRRDETLREVRETEDIGWKQLDADYDALKARELELRGARAYADATSLQYRLGARKFAEWDNAQTRLLQAEKTYIGARRQLLSSWVDWERAAGVELEE